MKRQMNSNLSLPSNKTSKTNRSSKRGPKTTWYQRAAIFEWLNNERNFKLITGQASADSKGVIIAGQPMTIESAYAELTDYVNEKCNCNWNVIATKNRYRSMVKKYHQVARAYKEDGGGKYCLSEEEINRGITIANKLEIDCPGFADFERLYGGRQNIAPTYSREPGLNFSDENWGSDDDLIDDNEFNSNLIDAETDNLKDDSFESQETTGSRPPIHPSRNNLIAIAPTTTKQYERNSSPASLGSTDSKASTNSKKNSFSSVYADRSKEELVIMREELRLKQESHTIELELRQQELNIRRHDADSRRKEVDEAAKNHARVAMINQGKSAEEIVAAINIMFPN